MPSRHFITQRPGLSQSCSWQRVASRRTAAAPHGCRRCGKSGTTPFPVRSAAAPSRAAGWAAARGYARRGSCPARRSRDVPRQGQHSRPGRTWLSTRCGMRVLRCPRIRHAGTRAKWCTIEPSSASSTPSHAVRLAVLAGAAQAPVQWPLPGSRPRAEPRCWMYSSQE